MLEHYISGADGLGVISGALFAIGMMLLLTEAVSPGLGWGGIAGVACQMACFTPDVLSGAAPWWVFLLALGGGVLLLLDSHFAGLGPLGWLGVGLLIAALLNTANDTKQIVYALVAAAVLTGAAMPFALVRLPKSQMMEKIRLNETLQDKGSAQFVLPEPGSVGAVYSSLKPSGTVMIGGEKYPARASSFLEAGTRIRVTGRDKNIVLVIKEE